jgi:hypothetical protein
MRNTILILAGTKRKACSDSFPFQKDRAMPSSSSFPGGRRRRFVTIASSALTGVSTAMAAPPPSSLHDFDAAVRCASRATRWRWSAPAISVESRNTSCSPSSTQPRARIPPPSSAPSRRRSRRTRASAYVRLVPTCSRLGPMPARWAWWSMVARERGRHRPKQQSASVAAVAFIPSRSSTLSPRKPCWPTRCAIAFADELRGRHPLRINDPVGRPTSCTLRSAVCPPEAVRSCDTVR